MELTFLKAKIHRARVTHSEPDYEGSCAIDRNLLLESGIAEYEQIGIYNLVNGERISTYTIVAEADSGIVSMNGAAAHRAQVGDHVIICAYCHLPAEQAKTHQPVLVYVDDNNCVRRRAHATPIQKAAS